MTKQIITVNKAEYERLLTVAKTRRTMAGISKSKMASICGVTRQTIFNFEENVGGVNEKLINLYCIVLGDGAKEIDAICRNSLYEVKEYEV